MFASSPRPPVRAFRLHSPSRSIGIAQAILVAVLITALLPGCMWFTTKQEGRLLKERVELLNKRVKTMAQREQDTIEALRKARKELLELKDVLPKARELLLRNSARFGVQVDNLASDLNKLKGEVDNLKADDRSASKRFAGVGTKLERALQELGKLRLEVHQLTTEVRGGKPKTAAEIFARATMLRLAGKFAEARTMYERVLTSHPKDPRIARVHLGIAKSYHEEYDFPRVVLAVQRMVRALPNHRLTPEARLLTVRAYAALKHCQLAMQAARVLLRKHPYAEVVDKTKSLLARLRRVQYIARYCTRKRR